MEQPPTNQLVLRGPLSGYLMPIERAPDPVCAQKRGGDGISSDPLSQCLVAPCDGEVVQLYSGGHAVTLATGAGVEVLMHIGLDPVALKGRGFMPKVKIGDRVATGDALIEFEADYLATHAKSLLTQIIITPADRVAGLAPRTGLVTAGAEHQSSGGRGRGAPAR